MANSSSLRVYNQEKGDKPDFIRTSFFDLFLAKRDDIVVITSMISSLAVKKHGMKNIAYLTCASE